MYKQDDGMVLNHSVFCGTSFPMGADAGTEDYRKSSLLKSTDAAAADADDNTDDAADTAADEADADAINHELMRRGAD